MWRIVWLTCMLIGCREGWRRGLWQGKMWLEEKCVAHFSSLGTGQGEVLRGDADTEMQRGRYIYIYIYRRRFTIRSYLLWERGTCQF